MLKGAICRAFVFMLVVLCSCADSCFLRHCYRKGIAILYRYNDSTICKSDFYFYFLLFISGSLSTFVLTNSILLSVVYIILIKQRSLYLQKSEWFYNVLIFSVINFYFEMLLKIKGWKKTPHIMTEHTFACWLISQMKPWRLSMHVIMGRCLLLSGVL